LDEREPWPPRRRTYWGHTPDDARRVYAEDAAVAAHHHFVPSAERWIPGPWPTLEVLYDREDPAPTGLVLKAGLVCAVVWAISSALLGVLLHPLVGTPAGQVSGLAGLLLGTWAGVTQQGLYGAKGWLLTGVTGFVFGLLFTGFVLVAVLATGFPGILPSR
jgi:hypothetical protein